jgi:hypothetical protein
VGGVWALGQAVQECEKVGGVMEGRGVLKLGYLGHRLWASLDWLLGRCWRLGCIQIPSLDIGTFHHYFRDFSSTTNRAGGILIISPLLV